MKIEKINLWIDNAIRFFLFMMILWLPYSKAMIEVSVIASSVLWLIKRSLILLQLRSRKGVRKDLKADLFKAFVLPDSVLNPAIGLFLLFCFASIFSGLMPGQSLVGFICKTLEWFAIYFLVLEVFTKRKYILISLGLFVFTTAATGIDALVQYYVTGMDLFNKRILIDGYRVTAGFSHPNLLGAYLTVALPFGLSLLFLRSWKLWQKVVVMAFLAILILTLLLTFSRGAWMGVVLGMVFFGGCIFFKLLSPGLRKGFSVLAILMVLFALSEGFEFRKQVNTVSNDKQTVSWRLVLWQESWRLVQERPFLGHGLNTYMPLMENFLQVTKSPLAKGYSASYAHNCYLQVMVEVGLLGFGAFAGILVLFFRQVWKNIAALQAKEYGVLVIGMSAGLLGFLAHSFVDTNFYTLQLPALFWYFMGMAVALDKLLIKTEKA